MDVCNFLHNFPFIPGSINKIWSGENAIPTSENGIKYAIWRGVLREICRKVIHCWALLRETPGIFFRIVRPYLAPGMIFEVQRRDSHFWKRHKIRPERNTFYVWKEGRFVYSGDKCNCIMWQFFTFFRLSSRIENERKTKKPIISRKQSMFDQENLKKIVIYCNFINKFSSFHSHTSISLQGVFYDVFQSLNRVFATY